MKLVEMIANLKGRCAGKRHCNQNKNVDSQPSPQRLSFPVLPKHESNMRWSIVGMNRHTFVQTLPMAPTSVSFRQRVRALRYARLHSAANRDLACAIEVAVRVVRDRPAERCGIVYLTAGRACSDEAKLTAALDFAVSRNVPVHGIYIGSDSEIAIDLEWVCTRAALGYGSFHTAASDADLGNALRRCTKGLIAPTWVKGFNRTVFIVDLTAEMAESFGATCRIEACARSLEALIGCCEPNAHNFISQTESAVDWHPSSARAA